MHACFAFIYMHMHAWTSWSQKRALINPSWYWQAIIIMQNPINWIHSSTTLWHRKYICVCVCIHYICIYVHICIYMYICTHMCIYICIYEKELKALLITFAMPWSKSLPETTQQGDISPLRVGKAGSAAPLQQQGEWLVYMVGDGSRENRLKGGPGVGISAGKQTPQPKPNLIKTQSQKNPNTKHEPVAKHF